MFAVLSPIPYKTKKDQFGKRIPRISVEEKLAGDGCYYIIYAKQKRSGRLNYKKIVKAAGDFAGQMVMPANMSIPDEIKIGRYPTNRFRKRVLLYSFLEQADRFRQDSIGIVDLTGEFADELLPLLRKVKTVYILTNQFSAYEWVQYEAQKSLGCGPIFCESQKDLIPCKAILILNFHGTFLAGDEKTVLYGSVPGGYDLINTQIELPPIFTEGLCDDIDRLALASALYERLHVNSLYKTKATELHIQHR